MITMLHDDTSSIGNASAAVAMANDAIDNARRAAASSRSKRTTVASTAATAVPPATKSAEYLKKHKHYQDVGSTSYSSAMTGSSSKQYHGRENMNNNNKHNKNNVAHASANMDLKHNDGAYQVIATLLTERLLPKVNASPGSTHYTLTAEDAAFFQKMLPHSVRRNFVDALRYRLQLLKSGVGSKDSSVGKLTMQCAMLGLDRTNLNVLLELSSSAGTSYPINYKSQGPVARESPTKESPYSSYNNNGMGGQYRAPQAVGTQQQSFNTGAGHNHGENNITFGLNAPMEFSPSETFSPTNQHDNTNQGTSLNNNNNNNDNEWGETSAESLARQQIQAEINETEFLMRGSVTPDAVNFWQKHLEELHQRLVALSLEEQLKAAGSDEIGDGGNYENDMYTKVKEQYQLPNIQSREDYNIMGDDAGFGGELSPGIREYIQEGHAEQQPMASMPNNKNTWDELPVCDVVAPSDLPGGYMFEAQLGSKKFLATVPPGGVTKGQRFVSTMRELETIEIPVPLGAWRDGARECCRDGMCHPLFLNTMFFPCIALGQIMTRTGLDWQGNPANKLVSSISCANMTVLLTFWLAMNASAVFMYRVGWERGYDMGLEYYAPLIIFNAFVMIWMISLTKKVRESIRNKYQIPEDHCEGIEDCFCATFCMPCTICQMGRHTADFDTYRATCCTKTGLPRQVELAPVSFHEDDVYQNMQNMNDEGFQGGHMI